MDFPTTESLIKALADRMLDGYLRHGADFPKVSRSKLILTRLRYIVAKKASVEACAKLRIAAKVKEKKLLKLKRIMKSCLQKSEVDVAANPEKLKFIGWGPPKTPQSIEKPGQPNNLRSINQERGKLILRWNRPTNGSIVRNYIIQRRCQQITDGEFSRWKLIATALQNHITLTNQPQKSTLEYHVKAVNISGESIPSNTITVAL